MAVPAGYTLDKPVKLPPGYTLDSAPQETATPAPAPDFTSNPSGEGLYRMGSYDPTGGNVTKPEIQVPFSRVADAKTAGYKLHPDEISRYQKDSTHSTGPTLWEQAKSALMSSTEPTPDVALHPYDPAHPIKSVLDRAGDRAQNLYQAPINFIKAVDRGVYAGLPQLPAQLWDTVQKIYKGDPQGAEQLNQFTPPGMAASLLDQYQSDSQQYGPGAAQTNFLGNLATLYAAGKIGEGVAKQVPANAADWRVLGRQVSKRTVEPIARIMTDTGKGPVRELVEKRVAENGQIDAVNRDRLASQQKDQADADAAHRANLLKMKQKYEQDVRDATEKARNGTDQDRAQYQAKQLSAKQKYDQAVRDATEKHADAVAKARRANAEEQQKFNRKIGQTAQQNRVANEARDANADRNTKLQVGGSQLIYGLHRLDQSLREQVNSMYESVRARMAGSSLPSGTLTDAVKAAQEKWIRGSPEKVREFNAMVTSGTRSPELTLADQTAQNMGYKDFQEAVTNPQMRDTLSRALPPDVWKAALGQRTLPISWNDLQGFYEETGARIADGPQPGKGDIFKALQDVHKFIGDQMQQLADAQGTGKQFSQARTFYRDYMQTFHTPTGESGSGSPVAQALRAKDPLTAARFFTGPAGERGIADLRSYNDALANLAQSVQAAGRNRVKVPAGKSVADIPQPKVAPVPAGANLPLPPVMESAPAPRAANLPLPSIVPPAENVPLELKPLRTISTGDIHGALKAAADASAGKWWRRGQWAAAVPIIQAMKGFWGGTIPPLATIGLESAGVLATTQLVNHFLRYPPMVEFLTQARPENVAQIPPELRGDLSNIIPYAQKQGIKVSPALLAAFSGVGQQQNQQSPISPTQAMQAVLAGGTQ